MIKWHFTVIPTHLLALDSCLQPKLLTTSKTTMEILFQVSLDWTFMVIKFWGEKKYVVGSNDFYPLDVTRGSFLNLNPIHCCCWLTCDKGRLVSSKKVWRWCESYAVVHQIWTQLNLTQSRTFWNNWVHQKTKWVTFFYENGVNEVCCSGFTVGLYRGMKRDNYHTMHILFYIKFHVSQVIISCEFLIKCLLNLKKHSVFISLRVIGLYYTKKWWFLIGSLGWLRCYIAPKWFLYD